MEEKVFTEKYENGDVLRGGYFLFIYLWWFIIFLNTFLYWWPSFYLFICF